MSGGSKCVSVALHAYYALQTRLGNECAACQGPEGKWSLWQHSTQVHLRHFIPAAALRRSHSPYLILCTPAWRQTRRTPVHRIRTHSHTHAYTHTHTCTVYACTYYGWEVFFFHQRVCVCVRERSEWLSKCVGMHFWVSHSTEKYIVFSEGSRTQALDQRALHGREGPHRAQAAFGPLPLTAGREHHIRTSVPTAKGHRGIAPLLLSDWLPQGVSCGERGGVRGVGGWQETSDRRALVLSHFVSDGIHS